MWLRGNAMHHHGATLFNFWWITVLLGLTVAAQVSPIKPNEGYDFFVALGNGTYQRSSLRAPNIGEATDAPSHSGRRISADVVWIHQPANESTSVNSLQSTMAFLWVWLARGDPIISLRGLRHPRNMHLKTLLSYHCLQTRRIST